ncbi:MAG: hypothetical protein V1859_08235 [archaeon]
MKNLGHNKKSVFFSVLSVFIILIFYLGLKVSSEQQKQQTDMEVTRVRVNLLNTIVNDFENRYIERMLYAAGKSAIGAMSEYATMPGCSSPSCDFKYFQNGDTNSFIGYKHLESDMNLTMTKGELLGASGNSIDLTQYSSYHLADNNLDSIKGKLIDNFETLGLQVKELDVTITSVRQIDPWTIGFGADVDYYFVDADKIASWKGTTHKEIEISIVGMYDPISKTIINTNDFKVDTLTGGPTCAFISQCVTITGCNCIYSPNYVNKLKGHLYNRWGGDKGLLYEDLDLGICDTATGYLCNQVI